MRKSLALGMTVAMTSGLAALVPAVANAACTTGPCSQPTTVTFSLNSSGTFQINQASNAVTLASQTLSATGATVSGALPATTVTDGRAQVAGAWTVSISSTAFSDGVAGDPTIPASLASATTNLNLVAANNTAATTGGTALVAYVPVASLGTTASPLVVATLVQGVAVTNYTPSMSIAVPPTAVAGTYTGTVTQTLS